MFKHRKCGPVMSACPLVCYSGNDRASGYSTSLLKHFALKNETGCNMREHIFLCSQVCAVKESVISSH